MFNIRVYGILKDEMERVLVSDEMIRGSQVIKFCGGGLEQGEGIAGCLHREFMEELHLKIRIVKHLYTTDFYQESAFKTNEQVISVYYEVEAMHSITIPFYEDAAGGYYQREDDSEKFRWVDGDQFSEDAVTLPIDKIVARMISTDLPLFFRKAHLLENERVRLEPLAFHHFEKLLPIALQQELWLFTAAKVTNEKDFRRYFESALAEKSNRTAYPFAVYDKKNNCYAGSTRYGNIALADRRMEIGWTWYHPQLQGTGINIACKLLLLSHAFEEWKMSRVEQKTSILNARSQAAMTRLGATREGVLRRHSINDDGTVRDTVYFSYIAEEWHTIKREIFLKNYQP